MESFKCTSISSYYSKKTLFDIAVNNAPTPKKVPGSLNK